MKPLALAFVAVALPGFLFAQGRGAQPPRSPRESAPVDLAGYWVSVVTEDWRWRMVTPLKGDSASVPINRDAKKIVDAWDPAADEAAGLQCKAYGAAAIMRVPGRIHITWQDDNTLRVDTDAGSQTRLFRFGTDSPKSAEPTWQGTSAARWDVPGQRGRGGNTETPKGGSLTVVTTNMRAGYLRKNGVPYSEHAVLTEHFDLAPLPNSGQLLVVTAVVDDARYLRQPFIVSSQFKKQPDAAKWEPTPCSSTW